MKYIAEGAKALHKSDLVNLLQTGGVDIRDTNSLPKSTLTAILEALCKTDPQIAKSLSLDPQSVARVQRYAGEKKIGKLRLAKKFGFKPGNKKDDPKIAMLYRLLKVARRAKGEHDYSEIETVSQIQPKVSISTAFDSPEPIFIAENQRLSTAVHQPETSERITSSFNLQPSSRNQPASQPISCRDKCALRLRNIRERARRISNSFVGRCGRKTFQYMKKPFIYLKDKLCQLRERRRQRELTTVIGRRQPAWMSDRTKKLAIGAAIALSGGAVAYCVM